MISKHIFLILSGDRQSLINRFSQPYVTRIFQFTIVAVFPYIGARASHVYILYGIFYYHFKIYYKNMGFSIYNHTHACCICMRIQTFPVLNLVFT